MCYKYGRTTEEHLQDWKKHLSEDGREELDSEIEDYEWFALLNNNDGVMAIFDIINVHKAIIKICQEKIFIN